MSPVVKTADLQADCGRFHSAGSYSVANTEDGELLKLVQHGDSEALVTSERVTVPHNSLYGWMIIVARNRSSSLLRKKKPESLDEVILASPLKVEEDAQRKLLCERLVKSVPAEMQTLLRMAFYNDMSYQEIAWSTGVPLGTIKTRMRKALKAMRSSMQTSGRLPAPAACQMEPDQVDFHHSAAFTPTSFPRSPSRTTRPVCRLESSRIRF